MQSCSGNDGADRSGGAYTVDTELKWRLRVTFEETTQAAWLHEVIRAYVTEVIVCDPLPRHKLLEDGSKADKVDARKLAEHLRVGLLRSVYHGHEATGKLKELVRVHTKRSTPRHFGPMVFCSASPEKRT